MSAYPPTSPPPVPQSPTLAGPAPGPGRKWYLYALLLLVIIGVPSLLAFLQGLDGITKGLTRVTVPPGEASLDLEAGAYTLFYEYKGEIDGQAFTNPREVPDMEVTVFARDGRQLVGPPVGSFDYNIGGHAGYSIGRVEIAERGHYVLSAFVRDSNDQGPYVVALGKDLGRSTVFVVIGIIGMIGAATAALLMSVIVLIMRSRAKSKTQAAGY